MLFQSEWESLRLEVANYELPHAEPGEDADWLVLKGSYQSEEELVVDRCACITAGELRQINAGLKVLAAGIREGFDSREVTRERDFTLAVYHGGEGRFRAEVRFAMRNAMVGWETAEVDLDCDVATLKAWSAELDAAEKKYPERK